MKPALLIPHLGSELQAAGERRASCGRMLSPPPGGGLLLGGSLRTHTVLSNARPFRIAFLLDINDEGWHTSCLFLLDCMARTWGGYGSIIVPTDGNSISPPFWRILEAYDPDYLIPYQRTLRDLQLSNPAQLEERIQERRDACGEQFPETDGDKQRQDILKALARVNGGSFSITESLEEELKRRLAPFYIGQMTAGPTRASAASDLRYPHTLITKVVPVLRSSPRTLHLAAQGSSK